MMETPTIPALPASSGLPRRHGGPAGNNPTIQYSNIPPQTGRQARNAIRQNGRALETEQTRWEALKAGEESAFRQLIEAFQEMVLNTCLGFIPNLQDAEDLTQEVFVEVYQSVGQFREEASLSTWIYRIAVNKCLEEIRYRKRRKRMAFFKGLLGLEPETIDRLAGDFNHPGYALEDKERAEILYGKIEELHENQRIAFTLHKVEGLSHKEVATIMDVSVSAVEALMHRAKRNLRKGLADYYLGY
jgi:RNA polymerase sigma-70 factor (ECF subfamily)